jgi:hypothetical protein
MTCPECKVENPAGGKFCIACGSALEIACTQCGGAMRLTDRFCGSCGEATAADEQAKDSPPGPSSPKQYTPQEIELLLFLRRSMRREETASKTLNQDDVDQLFG